MNPNRKTTGKVTGVISNLVTVEVDGPVSQNEICYIQLGDATHARSHTGSWTALK